MLKSVSVCSRVVCERVVCDTGRREAEAAGSAEPKTSTPHKHLGNKILILIAIACAGV